MSPTEAELAYRAALRALPDFRFGRDQLVHLLRALPPPPPDAPAAWRHAHLRGIIQEVRALDPRDAVEAMLVVNIIAARHAAAHAARRSLDPALSARQAAQLQPLRGGTVAGDEADGAHAEEAAGGTGRPGSGAGGGRVRSGRCWMRPGAGWPAGRLPRGLARRERHPVVMRGLRPSAAAPPAARQQAAAPAPGRAGQIYNVRAADRPGAAGDHTGGGDGVIMGNQETQALVAAGTAPRG